MKRISMDTAEFKGLSGCVNNEIIFNNKMKTITAAHRL